MNTKGNDLLELAITKGHERFIFHYERGGEKHVCDALAEAASRRDTSFDWFDAAVLSHQLGLRLNEELKKYLPKAS